MMFDNKKDEIQEIINALYNCNLEYLEDDADLLEENVINLFKDKYFKSFDWGFGSTRLVLIFKSLGFVIKIPLEYCCGNKLCAINGENYCAEEEIRFEWMRDEKVDKMFLETKYLTNINGCPIYIQQYAYPLNKILCNGEEEEYSSHTKEDVMAILELSDKNAYDNINENWEADVLSLYGKEFYFHFMNVVSDYGISDLRTANVGYIGNRPVIFDYAGFEEDL